MRFWELSGSVLRCRTAGSLLIAVSACKGYTRKDGTRKRYFYYACATHRKMETEAWEAVKAMLLAPERLERGLDVYLEAEKGEDVEPREGGTDVHAQACRG